MKVKPGILFWNIFRYTIGLPIILFLTVVNVIWICGLVILGAISSKNFNWTFIQMEFQGLRELWLPD